MAQLICLCGNQLSNCSCPNQVEGVLIKDQDMEFEDNRNCVQIADLGRSVWECDQCGRLAINHPAKNSNEVKWYKPENAKPGHLMRFDT